MSSPDDATTLPTDEIFWTVTDPDGNVVQSGSMSHAYMAANLAHGLDPEALEAAGLTPPTQE